MDEGKVEWGTSCKQDYSASVLGRMGSMSACQAGDIMWCDISEIFQFVICNPVINLNSSCTISATHLSD